MSDVVKCDMPAKTCEACRRRYVPKRKDSKCCSKTCSNVWHKRRQRERAKNGAVKGKTPLGDVGDYLTADRPATGSEDGAAAMLRFYASLGSRLP